MTKKYDDLMATFRESEDNLATALAALSEAKATIASQAETMKRMTARSKADQEQHEVILHNCDAKIQRLEGSAEALKGVLVAALRSVEYN